jgi:hypothetical protein
MSAKKAEEKKAAPAAATAPASTPEDAAEAVIANAIIAELDRVHMRTPRY